MLATIIQAVDTTIANVALPHMQGAMGATQDQIAWVLTSYIVAAAICMPLTGFLAAHFGRKRIFLWSVAGFTVASMLCGAAQSLPQIVLFRLLQGVFGASLVPMSQSVLLDSYPREQHASAMALWGVGVMVGPILGPTLGGWLTEYFSWRWVFYINFPVGLLAWFGIATFVRETAIDRSRRFDMLGFAFLALGIGALQMMLDRGQTLDWFASTEVTVEAMIAGLFLYLFVAHMFTHEHPFIEPGLFADRNFGVGLIVIFMVGVVLLATMALLPPFLLNLMGYPVVDVGFLLAPRGFGTMIAMLLAGRLSGRVDARGAIVTGLSLTALANDALHDRRHLVGHRAHRRHPGTRPGIRVCPALGGHLRHARAALSQRRYRAVQPDAQYRQQHRDLGGNHLPLTAHSSEPCRIFRIPRPDPVRAAPGGGSGRVRPVHASGPRCARRRGHAPGGDARLPAGFPADDVHLARHAAARPAVARTGKDGERRGTGSRLTRSALPEGPVMQSESTAPPKGARSRKKRGNPQSSWRSSGRFSGQGWRGCHSNTG
jgi:multidrug resistance protein